MAVLSVRVTPDEKAMLESAAKGSRSTISEFVRRKAIEAAELELMDRRVITLSAEQWDAFQARLTEPARVIPELKEAMMRPAIWDE